MHAIYQHFYELKKVSHQEDSQQVNRLVVGHPVGIGETEIQFKPCHIESKLKFSFLFFSTKIQLTCLSYNVIKSF